jgi:hypothetical protein
MADEVNTIYGGAPQQSAPKMGTNITSVSCTSQLCIVTNVTSGTSTGFSFETGNNHFVITGATSSGFNCTGAAGCNGTANSTYAASSITATSFQFTCNGCANGTYNSSTDPNMIFQIAADGWYTASGPVGCTGAPPGGTVYPAYTAISTVGNDLYTAGPGTTGINGTWPNQESTTQNNVQNWEFTPTMGANYNTVYGSFQYVYTPTNLAIPTVIATVGDRYRGYIGNVVEPLVLLTSTFNTDYGLQGPSLTLSTCSGNTLTFSGPHGVYNVQPFVTKLSVSGSSGCNGNYWVQSAPTATALSVWTTYGSTVTGSTGTINFTATGHTYHLSAIASSNSTTNYSNQTLTVTGSDPTKLSCDRGNVFTIAGTGTALDGASGYLTYNNPTALTANCSTDTMTQTIWGYVPNLSSTGGAALINIDNSPIPGRNFWNGWRGTQAGVSTIYYCMVLGCAGQRGYLWGNGGGAPYAYSGIYPQAGNAYLSGNFTYPASTDFNDLTTPTNSGNQMGLFQGLGIQHLDDHFWGEGLANLMNQRIVKYLFEPHLPSPDLGGSGEQSNFECAAHTSSYGNMLTCENLTNALQTATVNLTPYLVSGQNIIRYVADHSGIKVSTITAGTTSDSPVLDEGGATVIYLFSQNYASELNQPSIAVRLADITNATDVVIRWSYLPYWTDAGTLIYDCGATMPCAPPWDRNIGTIYYRIIYRNSSGVLLATSDVQTQ